MKVVKILLIVLALVFVYLFALNGRYQSLTISSTSVVYDKWTGDCQILQIGSEKSSLRLVDIPETEN